MALSALTFLNQGTQPNVPYTAYPATDPPRGNLNSGNLENQVSFQQVGYLSANQNVFIFQVNTGPQTISVLSLNSDRTAIILVNGPGTNPSAVTNFYSIDMGSNSVTNAWTLMLNITLKDLTTPSYIFVKGKPHPDVQY